MGDVTWVGLDVWFPHMIGGFQRAIHSTRYARS